MSVSEPIDDSAGGGGDTTVVDYVPERQCPTRVYINGTRVPAAETDVHIRKEGPLSVTRYAEANFASPWAGEDYLSILNTFGADQNTPDILQIDSYDTVEETHTPLFYGVITGVGSSPDHDNEKLFHVRGQGPGHYLENIPASKTFKNRATVETVLEYIVAELDAVLPESFSLTTQSQRQGTAAEIVQAPSNSSGFGILDTQLLYTAKSFTANKHTVEDVVNWLQEKIRGRIWIEPTPDGGELILSDNPKQQAIAHTAHYLDSGDTKIINNNALAELNPLNTVVVNGRAKRTLADIGDFELNLPRDEFVKVKARHKSLYQAAGDTELKTTIKKSDAESEQEVINEAKSKLKARVDGSTAGGMQVVHNKYITPFDTITARPTVNEQPVADVPAITHEVHRAHYKVRPNEQDVLPHIELNVGIRTDIDDDIEIVRSWREDA